jgi:hypothetical protein
MVGDNVVSMGSAAATATDPPMFNARTDTKLIKSDRRSFILLLLLLLLLLFEEGPVLVVIDKVGVVC